MYLFIVHVQYMYTANINYYVMFLSKTSAVLYYVIIVIELWVELLPTRN